jgi:hypothetical protein
MGGSNKNCVGSISRHTRLDQLSAGKGYTGITGQNTIGIADKQVGRSTDDKRKELSVGPLLGAGDGHGGWMLVP